MRRTGSLPDNDHPITATGTSPDSGTTAEDNRMTRPQPTTRASDGPPPGDLDALYAYHLDRVTTTFETVISVDNAELLARLLVEKPPHTPLPIDNTCGIVDPQEGVAPNMIETDTTTLGALLRSARQQAGLSLRDVAARVGVDHGYLARIETGQRAKPSPDVLQRLADTLTLDSMRLLGFFGIRPPALPPLREYLHIQYHLTAAQADELARLVEHHPAVHGQKGAPRP